MKMREIINIVSEAVGTNVSTAFYHGTSEAAFAQIESSKNVVRRVFTDANVSLGGAYLTIHKSIAEVAAGNASRAHDSNPVILTIKPLYPLFPDEDWVVAASEHPHDVDFDWDTEQYKSVRYRQFFHDLFSKYMGDGHSLSDEYARRYNGLNKKYKITFNDSLRYTGSVRQAVPISADQIINVTR